MKKTLVAMAAIAATASSLAQVTMSGALQYGYSKAATGITTLGTGAKSDRNHLNIAANEDLGGGMNAGVFLQNRFNMQSGRQSTTFVNADSGTISDQLWEQSMIYLNDSKLGEVKLGRFSSQLVSVAGAGHFMEDYGTGTHSGTAYGRNSSQFQYTAPSMSGFQPFILQAAGNGNKYMTSANSSGFAAGTQTQQANASFIGFNYVNGPLKTQITTGAGFNKEKFNIINAQYTIGTVDFALNQMNQRTDQYAYNSTVITSYAHTSTELGAQTMITPNLSLSISTLVNNKAVTTHADTKRAVSGLRAKYSLSKRTYFEGYYGSIAQDYGTTTGTAATAGANGSAYYMGLAHTF